MREQIKDPSLDFVFEECDFHKLEDTQRIYLEDFGKPINNEFEVIEVIASGSIGQVYKVCSKSQNKIMALKSKHPGINESIGSFVRVVKIACWLFRPFNKYNNVILEYIQNINLQLDYNQEAENMILLKEKWKNESTVIVPEVYNYSDNFICMSYHEGTNYNLLDSNYKLLASLYINFIILNSLLVHDFLHADLHTGNWKVVLGPQMKILMYDCGIMCSTGNKENNKLVVSHLLAGSFDKMVSVVSKKDLHGKIKIKNDKRIIECAKFIKDNLPENSVDRVKFFINNILEKKINLDKGVLHVLTAFAIIGEIGANSSKVILKYETRGNFIYECIIYFYIGLLENIGIFNELKDYLKKWMDSDKCHNEIYLNWLMENFGHKKPHLLNNIIYKNFKFK